MYIINMHIIHIYVNYYVPHTPYNVAHTPYYVAHTPSGFPFFRSHSNPERIYSTYFIKSSPKG